MSKMKTKAIEVLNDEDPSSIRPCLNQHGQAMSKADGKLAALLAAASAIANRDYTYLSDFVLDGQISRKEIRTLREAIQSCEPRS